MSAIDMINLLGLTAGTLTTVSFLPQVIKTWKSKSAEDIRPGCLCCSAAAWRCGCCMTLHLSRTHHYGQCHYARIGARHPHPKFHFQRS